MDDLADAFAPLGGHDCGQIKPPQRDVDQWRPILPVPADAPTLTNSMAQRFASAGYAFVAAWTYCDTSGRLLGSVVRYDRPANGVPADKEVKPFTFCEGPGGRREWRSKGFPEPRPLYRLDHLAGRPDAPVLVVEGEKAADAAAVRFPDFVVVLTGRVTDFAGAVWPSGTITFGRGESSKTITISVAADTTFETDETFTVALSNPIGGVITTGTATGTIKNDDAAPTYAIAVSGPGAEDGTGALTYTVTRTGPTDIDSTITYALGGSADSNDYIQSGTDTLTFAAGATTASFTIDPTSDTIFEFDETVIATLGTPSDGGAITASTATGRISNDDPIDINSTESQDIISRNYNDTTSDDGRFVVFHSGAGDLVSNDTNLTLDVFVRDLLLGTTERVSVSSAEAQANNGSWNPVHLGGRAVRGFSVGCEQSRSR